MNGLFMMLKTFGLDPDELMGQATQFQALAQNAVDALNRIEAKQDRILALLETQPQIETVNENGDKSQEDNSGNDN